jgi:hypothetical protein
MLPSQLKEYVTSPLLLENFNPKGDFPQQSSSGPFFEIQLLLLKNIGGSLQKFNNISFQGGLYPEIHNSRNMMIYLVKSC